MKHSIIMEPNPVNGENKIEDIQQSLDFIEQKLDAEIQAKQNTISHQEKEIERLHILLEGKDKIILETSEKLAECAKHNEGNRQLINKLLGDIDRLNQEIEWYKRTYVKRSFLGTIKERIFLKK
jgi:peptidoglycan hydrolase CwlO-like protein